MQQQLMAERERASRDRDASSTTTTTTTTTTRRQSFRRSLADAELPEEDLERLEAKRKQLDESIHKYIASKEREYKLFEKELIQKHKAAITTDLQRTRRPSSEPTSSRHASNSPSQSPRLPAQSSSAVNALLSAAVRREHIGSPLAVTAVPDDDEPGTTLDARQSVAGLTDRKASIERDREFIGVFTPAFLPALDVHNTLHIDGDDAEPERERADSAPPLSISSMKQNAAPDAVQRANSDPAVRPNSKRPVHLQLSGRTSSSGSSADGKLPSAMKSPTHRPRKKRVSLAVGDSIVAPSDNVPLTLNSHNTTPSHSRTRSPASCERRNGKAPAAADIPTTSITPAESSTAPFSPLAKATMTSQSNKAEQSRQDSPDVVVASSSAAAHAPVPSPSPPRQDVDGDLDFGLGGDEALSDEAVEDSAVDSEDDITGRVATLRTSPHSEDVIYESSEALIPEGAEESDDHAEHIEFRPSSVQQSNTPGFRRPSATIDPVYMGSNYDRAEHSAVTNEIYGSSFNRPSSKGSFTAGSLGESFMAQNAERLMRNRAALGETQVRS
ncbi:uncharacterized protein MYCFIDRAFT_214738 [Pseudocercospora fijiensis CIRAD86]|uniref:Uncharacterized protein n=1 Tax=Pseudocercospora fijiensis (strain CIRAD86) TaxID=383855 RepID=M3B513_PSEFD|nr:uncharacterized protein MYCFIDRAFT_214738 [Pseudocercospora fijiensis CIRAD86]EME84437.1 hypothetical protein MYCFIDRAFT_214738 [Pseudocercospora fijiensis CIRAD86]